MANPPKQNKKLSKFHMKNADKIEEEMNGG
jgi:hypothetical protein